ncbi:MAG: TIGR01906 family membrane protein [Lachnospiraceae bacterium]
MDKKRIATWIGSIIGSLCIIFVLLISAVEIGAYGSNGFYEKEYAKYDVLKDVKMKMPDVMYVTKEMMAFLKGKRETLIVQTVVDGQKREFFNKREIAHMEDVQHLFVKGMELRMKALIVILALLMAARLGKTPWKQVLPKAFQYTVIGFGAISAILTAVIATDFTKYFTKFHEIFFSNDLWLLDPSTDLLINLLPEGFFVDIAMRIGLIFGGLLIGSFLIVTLIRNAYKKVKIY